MRRRLTNIAATTIWSLLAYPIAFFWSQDCSNHLHMCISTLNWMLLIFILKITAELRSNNGKANNSDANNWMFVIYLFIHFLHFPMSFCVEIFVIFSACLIFCYCKTNLSIVHVEHCIKSTQKDVAKDPLNIASIGSQAHETRQTHSAVRLKMKYIYFKIHLSMCALHKIS